MSEKAPDVSSPFKHAVSENLHVKFHQVTKKIIDLGFQIRQETSDMKDQMNQKLQELENERMEIFKLIDNDKDPFGVMDLFRSNHYSSQISSPPVLVPTRCQLERYAYDIQKKAFFHLDACQRVKLVQLFPNLGPAHRSTNMSLEALELRRFSLVLNRTSLKFGISCHAINMNPHEKLENPFAACNDNGGLQHDIGKFADEDGLWAQKQNQIRQELEDKITTIYEAERKLEILLEKLEDCDEKEKKIMEEKVEKLRAMIRRFREKKAKFEVEYEAKIQLLEIKHGLIASRQTFPYNCPLHLIMSCFMEDSIGGKLKSHIQTNYFAMMTPDVLLPEITNIRIPNPDSEIQVRDGSIESIRIGQTVIQNPIDPRFKVHSDLMYLYFDMQLEMLYDLIDSFLAVVTEPIPAQAVESLTRRQFPMKFKMPFTSTMSLRIQIGPIQQSTNGQDIVTVLICGRPRNWAEIKQQRRLTILNEREMERGRLHGFDGPARSIEIFCRYVRLFVI